MKFILKRRQILIILFLALVLRIIWLDRIPSGLSNDELDYILNAKALFLSGSDISGTWNPISFTPPKSSFPQAELPPLITFIIIGLLPLGLFSSKLIYALFGVGNVILLYLITKKLIGEKAAFITGLVASLNPWLIFFHRTAYDTPLAITGYMAAWYVLLSAKGWKILLAFPFLLLGFYSYIGTKLLLIPFAFITIIYSWLVVNKKKFTVNYLTLFSLCVMLFLFYTFSAGISGARISELSTPNLTEIIAKTNYERKLSIKTPLTNIFSNRYAIYMKHSLDKYLNAFSPNFLFLHGDNKALFTLWDHGVFYYLDALLALVGIYTLLKYKKVWLLLMSILIISPLPSVASNLDTSYAIRSMMLGQIIIIFIGYGLYTFFYGIKNKVFRMYAVIILFIIYTAHILNFSNIYFLRNPISNSEAFNFSSRILTKYLSITDGKTYVISSEPKTQFKQYLFYTDGYNRQTVGEVKLAFLNNNFSFKNKHFINCKNLTSVDPGAVYIFEQGISCTEIFAGKKFYAITQLKDGGALYSIINDRVCSKYKLNPYPYGLTMADLAVEDLAENKFCESYIISYQL